MKFLSVVILTVALSLFLIPLKTTDAKIISPAVTISSEVSKEAQATKHSLASDAYQYYANNDDWYILDLEYLRSDDNRYYFGGFVALASNENGVGKWIAGSIPKKEVRLLDQEFAIPETVY